MAAVKAETPTRSLDAWKDSPFRFILDLNSRARGAAGERIVHRWLEDQGFSVTSPSGVGHDRTVNGYRVEIKTSTLWASGVYTFSQIRDQEYAAAIFLGLSPHDVHAWVVPKSHALSISTPQHGGATGHDTRWLSFRADAPPAALSEFGGDLPSAVRSAQRLLGLR